MVYERKLVNVERIFCIGVLGVKKVGKICLIICLLKRGYFDKYSFIIEILFWYDI